MRRAIILAVIFMIFGLGDMCHAAPPKTASLKEAWQNLSGKCGNLVGKDGMYEFTRDTINPQEGPQCVESVGSDVVVFISNANGSFTGSPQQYLIVPMDRVALLLRQ
jgi:hypothetical protein